MQLKLGSAFKGSKKLADILKRSGWGAYDITDFPAGRAPSWDELNMLKPVAEFRGGRRYFLAPSATNGQTLRDAYAATGGSGPSLQIANPDEDRWVSLDVKSPYHLAIFSRLIFDERFLIALVPADASPYHDFVAIRYEDVVSTFERHYGIVTSEGYHMGIQKPITEFPPLAA